MAGFLLGDTRELPRDVEEQFRASGLTHLLAVSGDNVCGTLWYP
jgi:competence protein ComEC